MSKGGCLCGNVRISYDGEPAVKALCHCRDCQKQSGSTYSTNIIVKGDGFKLLSGTPKTHSKTADGGNTITSHFCGDCGSTLWRDSPTFGENIVIKVGVMDDPEELAKAKPGVELFAPNRVSWVPETPGAAQNEGMPSG